MIALVLFFFNATPTASPCERMGPRLDGTYVTVCRGTVIAVQDSLGNSRQWNPATRTITARSPGTRPIVLPGR